MQEIQIPIENGILAGTLFPGRGDGAKKTAALFIHGWQSAQDRMFDLATTLSEHGITCLTVDVRGHGKTGGNAETLSLKDFQDDIMAAYDFLISGDDVNKGAIGIIGSSFGGYLAALLSAQRKLAWMILRVPADYPDESFEQPGISSRYSVDWCKEKKNWQATKALRAIHAFQGRVLIVESEKDEVVPKETLLNFKNAIANPNNLDYVVMKDAPHSLTHYPEFKKHFNGIVLNWCTQLPLTIPV